MVTLPWLNLAAIYLSLYKYCFECTAVKSFYYVSLTYKLEAREGLEKYTNGFKLCLKQIIYMICPTIFIYVKLTKHNT